MKSKFAPIAVAVLCLARGAAAEGDGDAPDRPDMQFALHAGYEVSRVDLARLSFSARGEEPRSSDPIRYRHRGSAGRLLTHGFALRHAILYQPSSFPLQLTVGADIGLMFGAPAAYEVPYGDRGIIPGRGASAKMVRLGLPLGVRVPVEDFALRALMIPGVAFLAIDEQFETQSVDWSRGPELTARAITESVRGQVGVDIPLPGPIGLYLEGGGDVGPLRGWNVGGGISFIPGPAPQKR